MFNFLYHQSVHIQLGSYYSCKSILLLLAVLVNDLHIQLQSTVYMDHLHSHSPVHHNPHLKGE